MVKEKQKRRKKYRGTKNLHFFFFSYLLSLLVKNFIPVFVLRKLQRKKIELIHVYCIKRKNGQLKV